MPPFALCRALTVFAMDSLAASRLRAIDQWSCTSNLFALCRAFYCGPRLYPRPRAPYDQRPSPLMIKRVKKLRLRSNLKTSLLVAACVLGLAACAGHPTPSNLRGLPERVELNGVPAFRGDTYQGGPAALASMLSQQGIAGLHRGCWISHCTCRGGEADLERNMQVLAREYGMLVYPLDPASTALLAQVAAGYPVMVRITEGSTLWAEPRYAVLVGFNQQNSTVVLRVARDRRRPVAFSDFESAWKAPASGRCWSSGQASCRPTWMRVGGSRPPTPRPRPARNRRPPRHSR